MYGQLVAILFVPRKDTPKEHLAYAGMQTREALNLMYPDFVDVKGKDFSMQVEAKA